LGCVKEEEREKQGFFFHGTQFHYIRDEEKKYGNYISWTPLQYCCAIPNREEMVSLLLEKGADPFIMDKTGRTSLDIAVLLNRTNNIKTLENYSQIEMFHLKNEVKNLKKSLLEKDNTIKDLNLENQNLSLCLKDYKHVEKMIKGGKNIEFFIKHQIPLNGAFIHSKGDLSKLESLGAITSLKSLSKKCNEKYLSETEKSRLINSIDEIIELWKKEKLPSSIQIELDEECKRNMNIRNKIKNDFNNFIDSIIVKKLSTEFNRFIKTQLVEMDVDIQDSKELKKKTNDILSKIIKDWIDGNNRFEKDINQLAEKHEFILVRDEECLKSLKELKTKLTKGIFY